MDAGGNELESAAILTTGANKTLNPIHHRMPVIVMPERASMSGLKMTRPIWTMQRR
ncbi:MAG: SOS response-associated peptidase [Fimbriimonadaceae bacterium]|nr:SOS response-associated peptidase [Alphaproteobacteria bacterium]